MSTNKSVAKSAAVLGLATLTSRLLGFIRDVVIARVFGVYVYAQAFVIAFKIPNLFRDLAGEGAANAAFVPVFSEYTIKHTKEEFWELVNVVLNLLLVILMAITLLGILFAPVIVRLIAPGFLASAEKFSATVKLTRIIFPYVLLICLAAYAMAILNSLKHFAIPAFSSCLLNISIIVFALVFGENIKGLATGVLVGGVLQLGIQVPILYKKGFRLKFFKRFCHPAARVIGKLMLPRLVSSSVYQLNNFVDSIFGSLAWVVGEGGVAILYFSYRLILFPMGIFSTALSQAILPTLSTQALDTSLDKLKHTLSFGLRSMFFVILPASVGFIVLSQPVISTLFGGGKFDLYAEQLTAQALFFYSFGLFAYGSTRVLQSAFFALKDTVTPAKVAGLTLGLNIILNSMLMFPLKIGGIALATSISGIITFFVLFTVLKNKLGGFAVKDIAVSFLRILLASLCMGAVSFSVSRSVFLGAATLDKVLNLGAAIFLGVLTYIASCFIFRVREMQQLWDWVSTRKP